MREHRDNQRSRVYAWEGRIKSYYRRPEWKTIDEVAAFAKPIWRSERGRLGLAKVRVPDFVPASWGQTSALAHSDHRISLPRWARQGPVVLHEMAHRLTPRDEAHGPRFVGVLIGLLARHLDYDAQELMALADEMGVRYHVRSIGCVPVHGARWQVERALREEKPMAEMDLACWLDLSYLQVRGAAMGLIRLGKARWLRGKLVPRGDLLPPPPTPEKAKRQPTGKSVSDRAKKIDVEIERLGDSYVVWPPAICATVDDPFEGDHSAADWSEVEKMVERYEQLVAEAA